MKIKVNNLEANDYNPNYMAEQEFAELVAEVRHLGRLPKPIIVRRGKKGGFVIVDGEHNWKAAKKVGFTEVPCEVIDVDGFEAMRQTYKRNQHGTHNKIILGRMFQRMAKEKGLSLRQLAKEIEVSEGTIRNAFEYTTAIKVRNAYAGKGDNEDVEAKITGLSLRQVRLYNRLPGTVANMWADDGADVKYLMAGYEKHKDASIEAGYEPGTETEYLEVVYGPCAELLQYVTHGTFENAITKIKEWLKWEIGFFSWGTRLDADCRKQFREYARYYYEGIWPFAKHSRWIDMAVNMIYVNGEYLLTPKEFDGVVKQMTAYAEDSGKGLYPADFKEYFRIAVYEKTGKKIDPNRNAQQLMVEAEIAREAPDYIQQSALRTAKSKYALWKIAEELQTKHPDKKPVIEKIAMEMALQTWIRVLDKCTLEDSIKKQLCRGTIETEEDNRRESLSAVEMTYEIASCIYDKKDAEKAHKAVAVKLFALQEEEIRVLHDNVLYRQWIGAFQALAPAMSR